MKKHTLSSRFLLALACMFHAPAVAAEYHVATTENDTGSGSAAAPALQPFQESSINSGFPLTYREK